MDLSELPEAFTGLYRAGHFDYWGAPYSSLTAAQREEIMRTRWSRVLVLAGIEWDKTPEDVIAFRADDMSMRPGLVPFAGDGSGDQYCWYLPWQGDAPEPPVVFWSHDGGETELFARSIAECVLRCILRDAAERDDDAPPRHWREHATMIGPWLDAGQRELLAAVGNDYSRSACEAADAALARQVGERRLLDGMMPRADIYSDHLPDATRARLYAESEEFWAGVVEGDGNEAYRPRLDAARASARRFSH
jgi:hypothetical protein